MPLTTRDSVRILAGLTGDRIKLIRKLRTAFTATEFLYLDSVDEFRAAMSVYDGSEKSLRAIVTIGGALLVDRDHRRSVLARPRHQSAA